MPATATYRHQTHSAHVAQGDVPAGGSPTTPDHACGLPEVACAPTTADIEREITDCIDRLEGLGGEYQIIGPVTIDAATIDGTERARARVDGESPIVSPAARPGVTRANLRASMADGATFGVMVGVGESYLAAFALAIGLGEIAAGLVSSVPLLVGGVLQLISLRAVYWFGGEKRWILFCATLQGLSFFPLVWAAYSGSITLVPLLAIASLYWAGGLASGPPWNTWMESIVPSRIRPSYFAKRTRMSQLCTLIGLVGGGTMLQWADNRGFTLVGFAAIFAAAGLFRMWSVTWLAKHQTPERRTAGSNERRATVARLQTSPMPAASETQDASAANEGALAGIAGRSLASVTPATKSSSITGMRLLTYLVAVQAMVQISGPYFSPYMLKQLEFSYSQFVTLLALGFLSKIIALSYWGRLTHRDGAKRLLWIGGIGIVPLSSLWIISDNIYQLALVQMVSGIMWAAYELGFFLMFFETLPIEKRTRMLTFYNLANMIALCGGAFLGAAILKTLGGGQSAYWVLFGTSSVGRFLALGFLFGAQLRSSPAIDVCLRVLGVRLSTSTVDSPILSTFKRRGRD
jgi:MFS family permease